MLELKTSELSLEDIFLKLTMGEALPALENTSDKEEMTNGRNIQTRGKKLFYPHLSVIFSLRHSMPIQA